VDDAAKGIRIEVDGMTVGGPVAPLAASELGAMLREIAASARITLGADRATCYAYDVADQTVAEVHTTEADPERRAFLDRTVGLGARELPIWRMQVENADPLLVIEDLHHDARVPEPLARRLGAGALLGVRLEHPSVAADGRRVLLGTLFCSFAHPRRFRGDELDRARGLASLGSLALATAHLHAAAVAALDEHRVLAAEQAALRRVATQVASESAAEDVFARVAREAAGLLDVEAAVVARFGADAATVVGSFGDHSELGEALPTTGSGALANVSRTGRRYEILDYSALEPGSPLRAHALANGYRASAAAPVSVGGRLWGAVLATTRDERGMPPRASERLSHFADLVGLAIANAEARARLIEQAATDALTGLANNRTFFERLRGDAERARRHGRPLSLIVIDLDHFKRVNDEHGHLAGDVVLVEFASRLRTLTRAGDTLARVGGEEFAWLLPEARTLDAMAVAERARVAVGRAPFAIAGPLTLSAGVAELGDGMTTNDLYRAADSALYAAKARGRDRCVPWPVSDGVVAAGAPV
jgi:diguanylate cyclase (GGDEF)-like protein